jgi:hypothetical protein
MRAPTHHPVVRRYLCVSVRLLLLPLCLDGPNERVEDRIGCARRQAVVAEGGDRHLVVLYYVDHCRFAALVAASCVRVQVPGDDSRHLEPPSRKPAPVEPVIAAKLASINVALRDWSPRKPVWNFRLQAITSLK